MSPAYDDMGTTMNLDMGASPANRHHDPPRQATLSKHPRANDHDGPIVRLHGVAISSASRWRCRGADSTFRYLVYAAELDGYMADNEQ